MNADSVKATLENVIKELKKDKLSDLEWESLGYKVDNLLGPGQLFNVNPQYEKLSFIDKTSPLISALRDLTLDIQNRAKEAAYDHATLALRIWELTSPTE
jgi:hypothetical protein